jgi:tight adherence protein B
MTVMLSSQMAYAALMFVLAAASVGGVATAMLYPRVARPRPFNRRLESLAFTSDAEGVSDDEGSARDRKKAVEKTLMELEAKQQGSRKGNRPTLAAKMRQAGLSWSFRTYVFFCVAAGLACYVPPMLWGFPSLTSLGFAVAGGLLLPRAVVNRKRKKRLKRFSDEFPNAIDVVVRGLKAGLPVSDCMRVIASEAQNPVKSEFAAVVADQSVGIPVDESVHRLWERVPLAETSFFSIVVAVQAKTGGSLSEALGNLSKVLRERKNMQAKIKAMSSEAKTSAMIIGAMPFLVSGALFLTAPDYMTLLFTTMTGKIVLAGCAMWMGTGTLIMRKMINFEI